MQRQAAGEVTVGETRRHGQGQRTECTIILPNSFHSVEVSYCFKCFKLKTEYLINYKVRFQRVEFVLPTERQSITSSDSHFISACELDGNLSRCTCIQYVGQNRPA